MPNKAGTAARRAAKAAALQSEDTPTVTAVKEVNGFKIDQLGDYEFSRAGAGRKREPSPFDDMVEELVGQGPARIPVADQEEAQRVIKDLAKACEFRERGLEKRVDEFEDVGLAVVFRVNEAKAKRSPRARKSEVDAAEGAETE